MQLYFIDMLPLANIWQGWERTAVQAVHSSCTREAVSSSGALNHTAHQPREHNECDFDTSLMTEREVAEAIGISVGTVRRWRLCGRGPTFIKFPPGRAHPYATTATT